MRISRHTSVMCAVIIVIAAACSREPVPEGTEANTSFTYVSDVLDFVPGDRIAVKDAAEPFVYTAQDRFVGDVLQSDDYYAVYPSSAIRYFSPTEPVSAVMTVPVVQEAVRNGIARDCRISVAHASDSDKCLGFSEKVSYLKFTIGPDSGHIRSISVVCYSAALAGDVSVMCEDGANVYPAPGAAYNVCLTAPGDYLEEGEYYIACRPVGSASLDVAYEDERGWIAVEITSLTSAYAGRVVDMGTVEGLQFKKRDIIPASSTLIYKSKEAGTLEINLLSDEELSLEVLEGKEWLSCTQTKLVSVSGFRLFYTHNAGTSRVGRVRVGRPGEDAGVIYTIVQYGEVGNSSDEAVLKSLEGFFESSGGSGWKRNDNWCTDEPPVNWYGLSVDPSGEIRGVRLSYNGLTGTLPETMQGHQSWYFNIPRNEVSGQIPSYIYDFRSADLSGNSFDSLADVQEPESSFIVSLDLSDNNIGGRLPERLPDCPHLTTFIASDNNFTGSIPDSYGKILERGGTLQLNGNSLSGVIPESIRQNPDFRRAYWTSVMFQKGEGLDFTDVEIYAVFDSYDKDDDPVDVSEYYAAHDYTVYCDFYSYPELLPEVEGWFGQYGEHGVGVVGVHRIPYGMNWQYDSQWLIVSSGFPALSNTPGVSMMLVDSNGRIVLNPASADKGDIIAFLEGKYGWYEGGRVPPAAGSPAEDGVVTLLQSATEGNGIDVVLMGDSYDSAAILDGTYESVMRETMEYFFDIEPFGSYRHLFNVYMVDVVSDDGSRLGVAYGDGTSMTGNDALCFQYAAKALTPDRMNDVLVVTVVNSTEFAGSTYMYAPDEGDWGNGRAVSYVPKVPMKMDFRGLIQHEAGGHGFAKLADEYVSASHNTVSDADMAGIDRNSAYGWNRNIDFTDDPSEVKWAHILSDERYADEPEGVYEGAANYTYGIWRPSYRSIMLDNQGSFNAPSREAIWYRIHKLAYGPEWEYSFDDFAVYDALNRLPEEY